MTLTEHALTAAPLLTPLAVQNADVLRALRAESRPATIASFAKALGRDASNLSKTLKTLFEAGLTDELSLHASLTAGGQAMIDALDRANGTAPATTGPAGYLALEHRQVRPDPDQPRKHFDEEELAELAGSIVLDGLLENLVVRPLPLDGNFTGDGLPLYVLVAGERRWRAIRIAQEDGRLPFDFPVPCNVRDLDEEAVRRVALIENLQRKDLKPLEEARAIEAYRAITSAKNADVATMLNRTPRFVQRRLQLLQLPADKQTALEAGKITLEEAWRWLDNRPTAPTLSPKAWLICLDLLDAIQAKDPGDTEGEVDVSPEAANDPALKELTASNLYMVSGPHETRTKGYLDGRRHVRLTYYAGEKIRLKFAGDVVKSRSDRMTAQDEMREEAGVGLGFVTSWLKGPHPIDEALADRGRRDRTEDEARNAVNTATAATARARLASAAQRIDTLLLQNRAERDHRPASADLVVAAIELGQDLPWRLAPNGDVMTANGQATIRSGYGAEPPLGVLARNRLLVLAVNSAAGLATPAEATDEPAPVDGFSRPGFVHTVASCLLEDAEDLLAMDDDDAAEAEAFRRATRGLDAFLAAAGIDYGAAGYDWSEDGAMAIAEGIRVDGLGQPPAAGDGQIDLKTAIAGKPEEVGS